MGLIAVLASSCSWFDSDPPPTTIARPPEADVAYGTDVSCAPGVDPCTGAQTVDIYRSDEAGPNPVLVWIHGGGFVSGDKATGLNEHLAAFLDAGWDIVSMNYRLSTEDGNQFPAALHDAKRVVRWVKASAAQQDWDPTSVATAGHSAGGNLAAMLAVTVGRPRARAHRPDARARRGRLLGDRRDRDRAGVGPGRLRQDLGLGARRPLVRRLRQLPRRRVTRLGDPLRRREQRAAADPARR